MTDKTRQDMAKESGAGPGEARQDKGRKETSKRTTGKSAESR